MSAETDLYARLISNATIADEAGTRIYPVILPDNVTYPAITYSVVSQVPEASYGCDQFRFQIDIWAATYAAVKSLRDALVQMVDDAPNYWLSGGGDRYEDNSEILHQSLDVFVLHERM